MALQNKIAPERPSGTLQKETIHSETIQQPSGDNERDWLHRACVLPAL